MRFNPFDPRLAVDPYTVYREVLRDGPAHYDPELGTCFVWGHDEARNVTRIPTGDLRFVEFQAARLPAGRAPADQAYCQGLRDFVVAKSGDDHRRVRGTFARHFTPARVASLHAMTLDTAHGLVDRFAADGRAEMIAAFASPLPLTVISSLLGIGSADTERIAEHLLYFTRAIQFLPMSEEELDHVNEGFVGLRQCFEEIVANRRDDRGDDLLSMLITEADDGVLSHGELLAAAWGLYAAGYETTTGVIGLALLTLLEHPDQLALLRADRSLIPGAVEELLRFRGLSQAVHRIFPEPVEVGGETVPPGAPVVCYIAAGNHDERWCTDPSRFDVTRSGPADHLTFSDGPHKCPGQHLARSTIAVAIETVLDRLPGLRLAGEVTWNTRNLPLLPVEELPLAWDATS